MICFFVPLNKGHTFFIKPFSIMNQRKHIMTVFRKITALLLALFLLLPGLIPARAAQESTTDLVRKLINYFHYYQEDASLEYELILEQIREQDPALADTWASILNFWTGVNTDMEFHSNVLPDGLPEDDSLCIVIMGYQLNKDGSMRKELISRMEVALASAWKYPNAYIMCTGGGTASKNSNVTEAGQMAKWLVRQGVDSSRIIVEDNAMSTIQNAIYGCDLLYRNYPQVRSLAVITSDYHIYRSCLYFHTQAALNAYNIGREAMEVISNATCQISPNADLEIDKQVEGIGMLSGLNGVERLGQPWLTYLDHIQVSGETEYALGDELDLQITAVYSNDYSRDVTNRCNYNGFDFGQSGYQTVTVSYEEGLALQTARLEVYVIPPGGASLPDDEKPTLPAPEENQPESTQPEEALTKSPEESESNSSKLLIWVALCLGLLIILLWRKAKLSQKRRRRTRRPMNLS